MSLVLDALILNLDSDPHSKQGILVSPLFLHLSIKNPSHPRPKHQIGRLVGRLVHNYKNHEPIISSLTKPNVHCQSVGLS